jgi:hypothetical protein
MKCLIAISTCYDFEKNGNNNALRATWLPDVKLFPGLDYKFFFGFGQGAATATLPEDSILLPDVLDDYGNLTYKTRGSLQWAHAEGYDFVFRCFPDTYVRVARLMACGYDTFDYYGDFRGDPSTNEVTHQRAQNYASGGPGYWLSRRAVELLIDAPVLGVWRDELTPYVEDLWVGNILGRHLELKLRYFDDTCRFINRGSHFWPSKRNDVITSHLSCPDRYDKARMYEAHQAWCRS